MKGCLPSAGFLLFCVAAASSQPAAAACAGIGCIFSDSINQIWVPEIDDPGLPDVPISVGDNSCAHAFDGKCDAPPDCQSNTDAHDCRGAK